MPNQERFLLYFSQGLHLTSSSKRIKGLAVDPDCVDVVFKENATINQPPIGFRLLNWAAAPFMNVFLTIYLLGLRAASRLGLTDKGVIDYLQDSGANVVQTDRNFHRILATERRFLTIAHWAFVLIALFGLSKWIQFITPSFSIIFTPLIQSLPSEMVGYATNAIILLEVVIWFLFAGAIMGAFFIAATIEARNHVMINQIEEYIEENPNDSIGCLVVGAAHVPHLKELIKDSSSIELGHR